MAAVARPPAVPSFNRVEPGSLPLVQAKLPSAGKPKSVDASAVAALWVKSFNHSLEDPEILSKLFLEESYWKDQLCLSWEFHTLKGSSTISSFLSKAKKGCRLRSIAVDDSSEFKAPKNTPIDAKGEIVGVSSFITVKTDVGEGVGLVRLVQEGDTWKAFTLFTTLRSLDGHEELNGAKRPAGVEHGEHRGRKNWKDRRSAVENFEEVEPTVLVLGAGQAGLTSAARLQMLGINTLVVDREERVGDNWRTRYHQLVLHDPIWYDHLPYIPFPSTWPIFTPKDKLGEWFEAYSKLLELNVWTKTSIKKSVWDPSEHRWTVELERTQNGKTETRIVHPKHIVQATGHSGEANFPSHIPGIKDFSGRLVHSSKFPGAIPNSHGKGKKAIVVGCCNSGHDIAQDYYENGYDVTMIQRSSTLVVSAKANLEVGLSDLYYEGGPPVEDADMVLHSIPNPVLKRLNVDAMARMAERDKEILDGLEKAGFKLDKGPDDAGLWIKYLQRGGGYYIDVGCSSLIASGAVKVKSGVEIVKVLPIGMEFSDGSTLEADEIVFATGYQNMRTQTRTIFGDEVADKVNDVWGLDSEGEIRSMWRRSGHEGFWFMGGNLALCRFYSRLLALQIKGLEERVATWDEV